MELFKIPKDIQNVVVHTDVLRGMKFPMKSKDSFLNLHFQFLSDIGKGKSLFFPSFNYSCLKTGKYQVQEDEVQVGVLNEYIRKKDDYYRDSMPVFNFVSNTKQNYVNIEDNNIIDPFGFNSTFDFLKKNHSFLLHYGSDFHTSTIIHYVERLSGKLVYRYDKEFSIEILNEGIIKNVKFNYHVRPLFFDLDYDWFKLEEDIKSHNLLHEYKSGRTKILGVKIDQLVEYWLGKLDEDPLYFLDVPTKRNVLKKLDELGTKFELKHFE
jgi:aminoglycoside N3'-acetyltransferase